MIKIRDMFDRKVKDFQVKVRVRFSPGSLVVISKVKTGTWKMSVQGRGQVLPYMSSGSFFVTWEDNWWSILWLLDFWMFVFQTSQFHIIYLDRTCCQWDGDITGRESPGWVVSWRENGCLFAGELKRTKTEGKQCHVKGMMSKKTDKIFKETPRAV